MLKINRVDALDGDTLDVQLSNGHTLLVDLSGLIKADGYAALRDPAVFCRPLTDGCAVYWRGGPALTMDALFHIIRSDTRRDTEVLNDAETE